MLWPWQSALLEICSGLAHHHRYMEPADSIRRLGFSRWYERRLIEGHAWFISVVFCMIAIAACMEELSFRGSVVRLLLYVTVILAAAAIGIYGMVRYQKILSEAESIPTWYEPEGGDVFPTRYEPEA